MNRRSVFTFAALIAALAGTAGAQAFDPAEPVALPRDALSYFNLNEAIQMADAYGTLSETAHGTFGKFPARFDSGPHTHTGAYHGIVLKGLMANPFEDQQDAPRMPAGSYWYVPAGMVHSTACLSDEPCEFFFFADGPFDFLPVK